MLELNNIRKSYVMGDVTVHALRDVSLTIEDGDFVAIMGPSGSGKSTLMHILGLLDVPDGGSFLLDKREVSKLSENELAIARRDAIGFIFQQFNLLSRMSALENVALPLLYSENKMDYPRAEAFLKQVGLSTRMNHRPNELSGGQQQRVAIARSLINLPRTILADEPTGNLDSTSEGEILGILKDLNADGITVIVVTHEDDIGKQANRVIRLRDGVIQSDTRLKPLPKRTSTSPKKKKQETPTSPLVTYLSQLWQYFHQGTKTLLANKVRTALSMLGILIGVAAVVAMLALGTGARLAIEKQLSSLGSNLLVLRAGAIRGPGGAFAAVGATSRLSAEDAQVIRDQISGVKETVPAVNGRGQVAFQNKNWNTQIQGVGASYARMHAALPESGRFFTDDENRRRALVAVIGTTIVRELFGDKNPLGEMIKINKVNFQVIGVLPEKGANGFFDQDNIIDIPVFSAMHRLMGKDYVDSIDIEVADPAQTHEIQDRATELMLSRHKVPASQQQDAFQIRNMADIQAALSESTKIMTLLLSIIAAISLLVGGIGIMNIMLVSVTERTREIGLRKAVGACRQDILAQFLSESVVISAVGGLLGILFAWIITTILASVSGWATSITVSSVTLAFGFSASIGLIFGIYPAQKAAALPPIDALRFE